MASHSFRFGFLLLLAPALVFAQAPPPSTQPASPPAPFTAGWQNGFALQSANGDYRLQFGFLGQVDGRFSVDDPSPIINTFNIRRARAIFSGRFARYFDYRLMPDFGNGTTALFDAYVDVRFSAAFRVRTGKDKTPVGYELLLSDPTLPFPERSLPSSLVPNRDIGVQAQGDLFESRVSYAAGVFNGVPDGASTTSEVDTNNDKDFAGRVVVQPFRRPAGQTSALSGLGAQVGASTGDQTGTLPSFKTSVGQTYFAYAPAASGVPAVVASGDRTRISPAVFYYGGPIGLYYEYVRSSQNIARGAATLTATNTAWDITGVVNVTGEAASTGVVAPKSPFDPPAKHFGALQLVARYAELDVDDAIFNAGFAAANSSSHARQCSVGVNWYAVQYLKYYLNYERTSFDKGAANARAVENVVFLRVQFSL